MKGNLIKITCLSLLTFSFALTSCNNNETKETETTENKEQSIQVEKKDINEFVDNYIKTLQTDSIKLVDSVTCGKSEPNNEQYDKGILLYHVDQIEKLNGDINADNEEDFVVRYDAENCWNGIGAGNYLSNIFFVISKQGNYEVDETGTMNFKQKFIDAISKEYKENAYKKAEKYEAINDIMFKTIKDGKGNGEFAIQQCGATPCVEGKFEYDFKTSVLTLKDVKKNQE
jgi:hypothetical protein